MVSCIPNFLVSVLAVATLGAGLPGSAQTQYELDCSRLATNRAPDAARLSALLKLNWDYTMRENPEFATSVGYSGYNDRWTDSSLAAIERRKRELHATLEAVQSIRRSNLGRADQLNYDLFDRSIRDAIEGTRFKGEYMPLNQLGGVQQDPAQTLEIAPRARLKDYEDMIARLKGIPLAVDQAIVLLKLGLDNGITPPRITLRDVPDQVKAQMEPDPDKNPLLKPFTEFPSEIRAEDRERLKRSAQEVLQKEVIPAYGGLYAYLTTNYIPRTRQSIGMSELPDGKAWYEYRVRTSTTTSLTPAEIHAIGLAEVKRIRGEMDQVIRQTGFQGGFEEFLEFLRTDPRFYYTNREDLVNGYRSVAKRIDPELIRYFGKLPRLPYGVLPVPAYSEKSQPTAYYQPGSIAAGRPGYFYANTYALNTRPKWAMEALTSHEAVPGHHLQISLAQELEGVPEFRKYAGYTAYVEGWALYCEGLTQEMGLYRDPYMKFGQLSYDMLRAVRLVLDTGLHSMNWTRQQAIDYFLANVSKNEVEATVEVDRYIVWPGQALAYKLGQMEIQKLRAEATQELGPSFDIRSFHDHVLVDGALPLDVLETRIHEWVKEAKAVPSGQRSDQSNVRR